MLKKVLICQKTFFVNAFWVYVRIVKFDVLTENNFLTVNTSQSVWR